MTTHELEIIGSEGKIRWAPMDNGPVVTTIGGTPPQTTEMPNAGNVHLPLVEDFVRAVAEARPPAVTVEEALKTNFLMDAVYESARRDQVVRL